MSGDAVAESPARSVGIILQSAVDSTVRVERGAAERTWPGGL